MRVIAKMNFWANGIEGWPGRELSDDQIDGISNLIDEMKAKGLIEVVADKPLTEEVKPEHLDLLESPESLESPKGSKKKRKK